MNAMQPDPIVEEVRKIRAAYAARFNFDLHAMCRDLREKERTRESARNAAPYRQMEVSGSVPDVSEPQSSPLE
jgi:hypothetical protein